MARKIKVDMTDVESFVKCSEGEHIARVHAIEEKVSSSGNDMLSVVMEVIKGSSTGARVYDNFVLTEKALWKLKGFLEVIGLKADGRIVLDLDKIEGRTCIIEVSHEEYNGSMKSRIDGYKKLEASSDDDEDEDWEDEEEEKPKAKPKKESKKKSDKKKPAKSKKKPEPEPEEDDEDDDDDFDDDWDEE